MNRVRWMHNAIILMAGTSAEEVRRQRATNQPTWIGVCEHRAWLMYGQPPAAVGDPGQGSPCGVCLGRRGVPRLAPYQEVVMAAYRLGGWQAVLAMLSDLHAQLPKP